MSRATTRLNESGTVLRVLLALVRTMRPRQWTKNVLVFAGLVFDGQLLALDSLLRVSLAFVLLCLSAGAIYIVNDLADIEKDRQHPRKKNRPLASGQLPLPVAVGAAVILPILSLGVALLYSLPLALVLLGYMALHIAYSFWLKHMVIIDVFAIAAGFMLRVIAGVVVIQVARFSPWLYVCTAFLALFLAVGKRRQELLLLNENAQNVRPTYRLYSLPLLDDMLRLVTTGSVLAYTLYTFAAHPERPTMLLTIPFVLYGIMRYLYLIHVEGKGSAPDEVLLDDAPLLGAIVLWGLAVLAVLYLG